MDQADRPIRLAIVDDYAVVVAGVAKFLAEERIDVVETGASMPVITDVDIVLYDTFGQVTGDGLDLEDFVRDSGAKVVIYSWNLKPSLVERAIAEGASGYLSKVLTGPAIVAALARIMDGETVILTGEPRDERRRRRRLAWSVGGALLARGRGPGADRPWTEQQADRPARLRRHQLGQDLHPLRLSKDRRRESFTGCALGREHGFEPDAERLIDPALRQRPVTPIQSEPLG